MTVQIKLNRETIDSIYQTEVIQPKVFKDYLHSMWMKEVNKQKKQYQHLEGSFSWALLRKWTEQDTLERAQLDVVTFKDFTNNPNCTSNLTCEERSICVVIGKNLDALYVCGTIISMNKHASAIYVSNKDLKMIKDVVANQKTLRKILSAIGS